MELWRYRYVGIFKWQLFLLGVLLVSCVSRILVVTFVSEFAYFDYSILTPWRSQVEYGALGATLQFSMFVSARVLEFCGIVCLL